MKTWLDFSLSLALAAAAAPLLLVFAALVKLTSEGPALYRQLRTGKGGKPFYILKLRTMRHDCERLTGPTWATENDPRVTAVGRFLRQTHLDELPQLWNVLRGEMSLVGPRPERPDFVNELAKALPRYEERLRVLPGLTGLAQVNLPPDVDQESVRRKLTHDLYYVEHGDLWMDARLLAATALFLLGVPFKASVRALGLYTTDPPAPRADSLAAEARPIAVEADWLATRQTA